MKSNYAGGYFIVAQKKPTFLFYLPLSDLPLDLLLFLPSLKLVFMPYQVP